MFQQDDRTESATPQRLRKARSEGKFVVSREFASAVQFSAFVGILIGTCHRWYPEVLRSLRHVLLFSFTMHVTRGTLVKAAVGLSTRFLVPLAIAGFIMIVVYTLSQLGMTQFGIATLKLAPDLGRLNPTARLKGLASRNLTACAQASVFFLVIISIGWRAVAQCTPIIIKLPYNAMPIGMYYVALSLRRLLIAAATVLFIYGAIDLFRQRSRYLAELKMTKQEIKDELRQTEGRPEVKLRIRRLRYELLRRRMMAAIPGASAVIANPTHVAIALQYEHLKMEAPKVVAKGKNLLAVRIRALAREHNVPIIENPPLAHALYKNCEVGQEIPEDLYRIVAEVLAYVFRLLKVNEISPHL